MQRSVHDVVDQLSLALSLKKAALLIIILKKLIYQVLF
jgi:hypothetical protein